MMGKLGAIENKEVQKYTCVFSDSHHKHGAKKQILKAKWLATNKRKEGRKVRRQKRSTIIPSCIAKLVTSTVLKFCKSRACQWLVRVSKFPMAALESKMIWLCFRPKFFAFAFKHSTFRSWETKQPSSPVLTWRLGQNSPLDLQFASRTRPDEKRLAPKSQPVRVTLTAAPTESSTEQVNLENPGDDFKRCVWWRPRRNHGGIFLGRLPDPVQAGPFTAAQLATIQDTVRSSLDQAFHSPGL